MYIAPPPRPDRFQRLTLPVRRRRQVLRAMLIGSILLHVLVLLGIWLLRAAPPEMEGPSNDQVAVVFENQSGAKQATTEAATPSPNPSVALGNPDAPVAPPTPDTQLASLAPPPTPSPPVPPTPEQFTPPQPSRQPPTEALLPDPTPPAPQPIPTPPQTPPTVSLHEDDGEVFRPLPPFVPPQPPVPLPPLPPRPAPPRVVSRPRPSSPFAAPQDWSFNTGPPQASPGHASRGFDMSPAPDAGRSDSNFGYVSGAQPSGDWVGALRRWTQARIYYPEQALAEHQQGTATVMLDIERSGRVSSVKLISSSRSQFLDGAWVDVFRRATVPPFTPDMTGESTTITYTLHYILVSH